MKFYVIQEYWAMYLILSVYYIFMKIIELISILYEVKNTFGEQHTYIFK